MNFQDTNLLIIAPQYITFVKEQVDALSEYFEKVTVIVLTPYIPKFLSKYSYMNPRRKREAFAADYIYDNVAVYFAKHFTLPFNSSRKKRGDVAFKVVTNTIEKEGIEFDLIHAHFTYPSGYVGAKLKGLYGKPLIITAHGYDVYDLPFRTKEWTEKISSVLNASDCIITVSNSNLNCISKLNVKPRVKVIPNGFNSGLFYPRDSKECRKTLNLPFKEKIIITVGNLVEVKGQKYLTEAMHEVVKYKKNVVCIIIGNGKFKRALKKQIKNLELDDYVKLVGGMPHDEIPFWLNACDLFVLPSVRESFGIVQIEAMACGKPVVATRNGGSEEIVLTEKLGILVEPKDSDELANAILKALDTEWDKVYISNYAKQYSWDKVAKKIMGVYIYELH